MVFCDIVVGEILVCRGFMQFCSTVKQGLQLLSGGLGLQLCGWTNLYTSPHLVNLDNETGNQGYRIWRESIMWRTKLVYYCDFLSL